MKKFLLILGCVLVCQSAFALDVVYPKKQELTINSPTTFFVGSAASDLTVNNMPVDVHESGGFVYFVNLNEGVNIFKLKSCDETLEFKITRPKKPVGKYVPPQFVQYKDNKSFTVAIDGAPLRSTPVDGGINRISHLQEGVELSVDGEKGSFYRVVLGEKKQGWISKSNVKLSQAQTPAKLNGYENESDKNYYTYVFNLDKKVPYEIVEGENIYLKIYNVEDYPDNTYIFDFPYKTVTGTQKIAGYGAEYVDNSLVLKIRKFPKISQRRPLKNITVTVDAGHGGRDVGAIGCLRNKEKDIVLKIAKNLEKELLHRGANVIMTRDEDVDVPLYKRVEIANENDSMFFVSIHANALPDTLNPLKYSGTSVYYYYNQSALLGANVLNSILEEVGTNNDKLRQASFAVVRNTQALSILVETAYLIRPDDNMILINPICQKKFARAIADGLEDYLLNDGSAE